MIHAAKLYNKCQTDVNNHSNKCSGPNLMDRIIEVYELKGNLGNAKLQLFHLNGAQL
jgi:hypothetical protein